MGHHSIALAQAFQFELMLRQKDVIGEYIPLSEPGTSEVIKVDKKWMRGLRWSEIDESLTIHHVTSKKSKPLKASLRNAPMVMEELDRLGTIPQTGPIVVCEATGLPWVASYFRQMWRTIADAAGIPKTVRNMDSRAGAISEAEDAEAAEDDIRENVTHSNASTTRRYMRGAKERKIARVQMARVESRNKPKT